jgi:predicted nucleic acid-binding protein
VEKAIKEGWIEVKSIAALPQLEEFGIDKGEAEAISLALNLKARLLLDQTHARVAAKAFGVKPNGTLFVLLKALKQKQISFDEFIECLQQLIAVGFRMQEEVYLEAMQKAKEIMNQKERN